MLKTIKTTTNGYNPIAHVRSQLGIKSPKLPSPKYSRVQTLQENDGSILIAWKRRPRRSMYSRKPIWLLLEVCSGFHSPFHFLCKRSCFANQSWHVELSKTDVGVGLDLLEVVDTNFDVHVWVVLGEKVLSFRLSCVNNQSCYVRPIKTSASAKEAL